MSDSPLTRRRFLAATGVGAACAALNQPTAGARLRGPRANRKAVKLGMVQIEGTLRDKFALLKQLGFDGVELGSPNELDTAEVLAARDATELTIHGVVDSVHWGKPLSHPDPKVRAAGVAGLERALRDAKDYGASTVLLVPAVVDKQVGYREAYERSQTEIRKALPLASELGVRIAIENVWNQFLLSPLETARYIDELDSGIVGAYFDVGNVVNYGWPEHWIDALGDRILKIDVKEFSRKKRDDEGLWKGFGVELHDGDCDWPAVMQALDAVGYRGWFTAEIRGGDETRLTRIAKDLDKILAYATK